MKLRRDVPRCWKGKDQKAPDGVLAEGWRIVRKGGLVFFAGVKWQHDALLNHEGETVFCWGQDYWQQECYFGDDPSAEHIICRAAPYQSPEEIESEKIEKQRRIEASDRESGWA